MGVSREANWLEREELKSEKSIDEIFLKETEVEEKGIVLEEIEQNLIREWSEIRVSNSKRMNNVRVRDNQIECVTKSMSRRLYELFKIEKIQYFNEVRGNI